MRKVLLGLGIAVIACGGVLLAMGHRDASVTVVVLIGAGLCSGGLSKPRA